MGKKVVFLDRDGVINEDHGYIYKIEDFKFTSWIFDFLKEKQKEGFEFIVVTNQSGIGRGYYTQKDFKKLSSWMVKEFEKQNIKILKIYHCPHKPNENCNCRKPKTGMIEQACNDFDIDLENSIMVGDKDSDMQLAVNAGIGNKTLV
jgi:D-glycero-D-manno-heptose 1,7-bisphosphate phosphatase